MLDRLAEVLVAACCVVVIVGFVILIAIYW